MDRAQLLAELADPASPDTALITGSGEPIRYSGRIDMMAVDQHDAYWIVRHRVVDADWPPCPFHPCGRSWRRAVTVGSAGRGP